jgi:glycosyltransferase involved in cell wall biosynthesis
MKRIICTVSNDLTYDQRMQRICESLAKAGYRVTLVGRKLPDSKPPGIFPYQQKRFRLFFNRGKGFYLELQVRLFFFLLFSRFDLICAVDLDTLPPAFGAAFIKRKKCILDAHEYFSEVPEVIERPLVKKTWELVARVFIPRLHGAYTVCESLADLFSQKYGIPYGVIRNVPKGKNQPGIKPLQNPFILIYQGVLNDGRGLEEVIEAMKYLENCELWLAGEGDLSAELRQLAERFEVSSKVKFLGRISPTELHSLTSKAHIGLNLLKNKGLNYYYSLANKAFDYIQAGIPSLSMDFPEYRRINQKFEVFHCVGSLEPRHLAETIHALQLDETRYQRLAKACLEASKEFVWEKEEIKLLAIYQNLLADKLH